MLLSHAILAGPRPRLHLERAAVREVLSYGKWIFVSTLFTFLANEGDRLILAKLVRFDVLGIYSIAVLIAAVPVTALRRLVMDVLFPAVSRVRLSGGDVSVAFRRLRDPLVTATGLCVTGIAVCAPDAIRVLYDPRYHDAGWMLQLLAATIGFRVLEGANSALVMALGEPRWVALGHFAKFVSIAVMIPLGFRAGGFEGALLAYVASELVRYAVSLYAVARHGSPTLLLDLRAAALALAATLVGLLAVRAIPETGGAPLRLLAGAAVSAAAYGPALVALYRRVGSGLLRAP
jgi:O-antigen/teichoic acid export membrane protein